MSATSPKATFADGSAPPQHVAIIMDGNGRWAKKRFLPRALGHREGAQAVRRTVRAAAELDIEYLTLYAFSSENWKRPADEVDDLMGLLQLYLRNEVRELHNSNVRIKFIGARLRLSDDVLLLIDESEKQTATNTGLTLVIALNYGAQAEIVAAVQSIAQKVSRGELCVDAIDEALINQHLFTADIPNPDLIIRTSGEQRLSNFLLWQAAYSELIFTEILWPDFDRVALESAISDYHNRERRYGGRSV
jgi:undecaprenyl diphosphate synthase